MCDDIHYLGIPYTDEIVESACSDILYSDSLSFDKKYPNEETTRHLNALRQSDKPVVISNEVFTKREDGLVMPGVSDFGETIRRMKTVFGEARIVLTIRRQEDYLASLYLQYSSRYYKAVRLMSFNTFFNLHAAKEDRSLIADSNYWRIVERLRNVFGEDNVFVLVFEEFVQDPKSYTDKMGKILNCDPEKLISLMMSHEKKVVNERISKRYLAFMRIVSNVFPLFFRNIFSKYIPNKIQSYFMSYIHSGPKPVIELTDEQSKLIADKAAAGNAMLEKVYGLDLRQYGYRVKS